MCDLKTCKKCLRNSHHGASQDYFVSRLEECFALGYVYNCSGKGFSWTSKRSVGLLAAEKYCSVNGKRAKKIRPRLQVDICFACIEEKHGFDNMETTTDHWREDFLKYDLLRGCPKAPNVVVGVKAMFDKFLAKCPFQIEHVVGSPVTS
jgi:hypothetical protein